MTIHHVNKGRYNFGATKETLIKRENILGLKLCEVLARLRETLRCCVYEFGANEADITTTVQGLKQFRS